MNETDAELAEKSRAGDLLAFERLIVRYERSVRGVAWSYLHDAHACDDATQETFVEAFQSLPGLRDAARFGPWLMQIARRTCLKLLHDARIPRAPEGCIDELADPRQPPISSRERHLLGLIEQLPDNERTVIAMRYFDGHSSQEIAAATGKPLGTITKQLSRAYERLRNWFSQIEETTRERK